MATRPIWRGYLRVALVTCPIALHSVVRASGELHFHLINPKTGNRVRSVLQDAKTGNEVPRADLAKGYEFEKDRYVLLDDDDFEKAKIDTSSTVSIDKFVPLESVDPIYFDTSYYVVPDGDAGVDVFAVLRAAIASTGQAALARVVIARRERAVAIGPMGKGLVCHTLHEPREINDARPLFNAIPDAKPDAAMVKLATQLIERQADHFEPQDSEDRYEARLREVIAAKLKGEGITPEEAKEPAHDNVIDLMAALKASLGRGEKASTARKAAAARNKVPAKRVAPARKPA